MREAHEPSQAMSWAGAMATAWLPADILVLAADAVLSVAVLLSAARVESAAIHVALHVGMALAITLLARHDACAAAHREARAPGPGLFTFLHYWVPVAFLLAIYFELGHLIPQMHSFHDYRYDRILQEIDVWLLGDPVGVVARLARPSLSEVLTLCYCSYYIFPLALPITLYARGALEDFRRVAAVTMVAFLLCYAGYFLFPAVGPHMLFDAYRPAALDGYGFARWAYTHLRTIRIEPPDAFPSGHTLVAVLVPALAWRHCRPLAFVLAPLGLGIVLATVYLRFHYVADVIAGLLLAPLAYQLGDALARRLPAPCRAGPAEP